MTTDHLIWLSTALLALTVPATRSLFLLRPRSPSPKGKSSPALHTEAGGRLLAVDATRAVAITGVMGIHAFYLSAASPGMPTNEWITAAFMNNMMRFAVPVFLFLSGFFLTPPSPGFAGLVHFFWKKIRAVILPYAAVTAVLVLYQRGDLIVLPSTSANSSWSFLLSLSLSSSSLWETGRAIVTGSASIPFYFVVVLTQMYTIYPLLLPLLRKYPTTSLVVILILSYSTAFPYSCHDIGGVPFFLPYLFPFALGSALSSHRHRTESSQALLRIPLLYIALNSLAASAFILLAGSTFSPEAWYTYNFQYFFAVAVAVILIGFFSSRPRLSTLLAPLGRYSLWVFLLHYPLQSFVWEWADFTNPRTSIVMALVLWTVFTLVAWALCWIASIMRKKLARPTSPPKTACG